MSSAAWQLGQYRARLKLNALSAAIDLARPTEGLVSLSVTDTALTGARILAPTIPSQTCTRSTLPAEAYVRGTDLVAAYEESDGWPVRVEALWRAGRAETHTPRLCTAELLISVRTSSLDSRPALGVRSAIPANEVLRLTKAETDQYDTLTVTAPQSPQVIAPAGGPGCLLFRIAADLSYAEMVHPADFQHTTLDRTTDPADLVTVSHHLFRLPLEKGVILRARVRGVFMPRDDDTRVAAEAYRAFAAAEPPLGT